MSNTIALVEEDGYAIRAEAPMGQLFLHCQVDRPIKSVLKSIKEAFEVILLEAYEQGHVAVFSQTSNERFVKFLGKDYDVIDQVKTEGGVKKVIAWPLV